MKTLRSKKLIAFEILMLLLALLFIYPVLLIAFNSVKPYSEIMIHTFKFPTMFQFSNFVGAWKQMNYPSAFMHTLIVTIGGVIGIVLVSSAAGYKLSRTKTRYSTFVFFLCILPMIISFSSIMITLVQVVKSLHMLRSLWGLMVIYWGLFAPTSIFLYHGFTKSIPVEIDESASMDGSSGFRTYLQIIMPLLAPITSTIIVLNALAIWNDFLLPLLVLNQSNNTKTLTLATYVFQSYYFNDWALLLAGLLMSVLPIIIFYVFMQRFIISGITSGAVKG